MHFLRVHFYIFVIRRIAQIGCLLIGFRGHSVPLRQLKQIFSILYVQAFMCIFRKRQWQSCKMKLFFTKIRKNSSYWREDWMKNKVWYYWIWLGTFDGFQNNLPYFRVICNYSNLTNKSGGRKRDFTWNES